MTQQGSDSGSAGAGLALILLTLAGWTVTPLFIEHFTAGDTYIDGWTSNGWRYGFAALLWAPLLVGLRLMRKWPVGLMRAALVPAAFNSAAQVCFTMAYYKIDPAMVTFGLRAQMVFTAVGAFVLFPGERRVIRSRGFIAGVVAVVVGTAGTAAFGGAFSNAASGAGVALAVGAGMGYAAYALSVRRCMTGYSSMASFAAISQYTALTQVALMLAFGDRLGAGAMDLQTRQFLLLLLSAVIGIAAGHVLYYMAIARLGVAVSTGVIQLQPFTVAALSIPLFGEELTPGQWAAGGVAVGGAMAMLWVQHELRKRVAAERAAEFAELPPDAVAAAAACEEEKRGTDPALQVSGTPPVRGADHVDSRP